MVVLFGCANGVGLAAPQVGVLRRVCIVEDSEGEIIELINPEIIETSGEQEGSEGCLSLPGRSGHVKRPNCVKMSSSLVETIYQRNTPICIASRGCQEINSCLLKFIKSLLRM